MAAARQSSERTADGTGNALRRRGILAAAGAVVAGLAARTAAPVGATTTDTNFVATGGSGIAFSTGSSGYATGVNVSGVQVGVSGSSAGTAILGTSTSGYALFGNGTPGGVGLQAESDTRPGVVGTSNSDSGVIGVTNGNTPGIAGGYFSSLASGGSGVIGQIFGGASSAAAFVGAASAGNYAAFFTGAVVVSGTLAVSGAKAAVVTHADGSHRLVYCEEAPESWFADYGEGTLVNGQASVTLDPDFAALIHTDDYHVFLTAYGNTNGLHVRTRTASGFTVAEHNGGTNTLPFSYRVVGKRADVALTRLAKFVMPTIKLASAPPALPKKP